MFNYLISIALKNRLLVLAISALVFAYGARTLTLLPVDVFPDLNRPTVSILTEAPGLAPEEVETLVTWPLETALNGAAGVKRVRSSSGIGLSIVHVEFEWGTDQYRARQLVQERLQRVSERLPEGVAPVMGPVSSIMGEIMLVGMASSSGETEPMEIRSLADWRVRQRLLTIPGVAQVIAIGGGVKQYQVQPIPERLAAYGITLAEVTEAARLAQANSAGGFIDTGNQEVLIRNIGRTAAVEDIAQSVVAVKNGVPILLRDLATITVGKQVMRGDAGVNGKPAVIVSVQKQPGADTVALTRAVEQALKELRKSLPADVELSMLFRQSVFIEAAIRNVEAALRDGAIIVAIVLVMFLLNVRTTLITLTAIPLSIVIAALVFSLFGLSINTMTLGGLAIAIGEMVDDAIVDVENVFRRLRENRAADRPRPALQVIYEASTEIRNSIVYATALVVLVFIPLFALGGIEGRLFRPIGVAYITSILASLLVAVTVTPVLCSYLLPRMKSMQHRADGWLVRKLKECDRRYILHTALNRPKSVIAAAAMIVVLSFALFPLMGRQFLPDFNEGTATINVLAAPGTSLTQSNRIAALAESLLLRVPEVSSVGRRTGRAEQDEHAEGLHYSELDVDFRPSVRSREEILEDIRRLLSEIPGIAVSVGQPISHRLDHLLSGVRAQIAIKIFGDELEALRRLAGEVYQLLITIPGIVDLQVEKQVLIPQVQIKVDREKAKVYGVRVGELNELLEVALNGAVVSQILDGQRVYELVVRYPEGVRGDVSALRKLLVDTHSGRRVPLSLLADIQTVKGPNTINRENVRRRIVVSANVAGSDLGTVVGQVEDLVQAQVKLPPGYSISFEGQFQSQREAARLIAVLSALTLAVMFLVLYAHFRSTALVLQILLNIPLACVGALILTYFMVGTVSVATMVGLITLCGIATRNTIMMISHYLHLMMNEGEAFTHEMIVRGSLERLVPVMMTALTAGLALIPLVIAAGEPGKEILFPVAVVILGGLVSSTLMDMAVTPAAFMLFGKAATEKYITHHRRRAELKTSLSQLSE